MSNPMVTDVDTCLREIADWYIKNRREITEPELEKILLKHCGSEAEMEKFARFLETGPGELRFKTLLRERKGIEPRQPSNPDEKKPLEFLNGYAVPLRERAPIEDRTRKLLLAEINSEWTSSRELLEAIEKKRRVYINMEWALHVLLDELLPEGKVGQATFYGSVASWWNNQSLSCPKCGSWEVNQFFTEGGILIHDHCTKCDHQWGGREQSPDTIFFNVPEARQQLISQGFVYTLRHKRKRVGKDRAIVGSYFKYQEMGPVWVEFIKEVKDVDELKEYLYGSGFESVEDWRRVAKDQRFLYKVTEFKR